MAAFPGNRATVTTHLYGWHMPGCNCGTGDAGCFGSTGTAWSANYVVSRSPEPELDLEPLPDDGPFFPPAPVMIASRPRSADVCRWREWAHARRLPSRDRAPPVMLMS